MILIIVHLNGLSLLFWLEGFYELLLLPRIQNDLILFNLCLTLIIRETYFVDNIVSEQFQLSLVESLITITQLSHQRLHILVHLNRWLFQLNIILLNLLFRISCVHNLWFCIIVDELILNNHEELMLEIFQVFLILWFAFCLPLCYRFSLNTLISRLWEQFDLASQRGHRLMLFNIFQDDISFCLIFDFPILS